MKTTLALLVTILAAQFGATAHAETVLAEVRGVDAEIRTVQLTDTGLVRVELADGGIASQQLSRSNQATMVPMAQYLGGVALKTEHTNIVCMMMVTPYQQNLFIADQGKGDLKLVLSMRSCAIHTHVFPKLPYDLESASALKSQLVTIAHELARN